MHALVVVAHPDRNSLSHAVARAIATGVTEANPAHSVAFADLAAEGFDPRFNDGDVALFRREAPPPADVLAEQARIDRASALVLVYPVFWWSMPGLLKGWIDRVFANNWAYDDSDMSEIVKRLGHLPVHLVALGGADSGTYARHGYDAAMRTQIDHGIFDYCGAPVVTSELLLPSDAESAPTHLETARAIGRRLFERQAARDAA